VTHPARSSAALEDFAKGWSSAANQHYPLFKGQRLLTQYSKFGLQFGTWDSTFDTRHSTLDTAMTIIAGSSAQPSAQDHDVAASDVGRAIVRLSGPQAFGIASNVFTIDADAAEALSLKKGWRRVGGSVTWDGHRVAAHAYVMPSPHSYTREDVIELHLAAIPWLVSSVLDRLLSAGARLAQPGEFTRRAFENGRITLEQAEAVGALIKAQTADEARAYAAKLQSTPQSRLSRLRSDIEDLLSMVELGLDFSHEDVGVLSTAEILSRLAGLRDRAVAFVKPSEKDGATALSSAELNASLPRVVLVGPVNAGKSSLFNALLKRDAAIVSSAAHTTRDAVEATLTLANSTCVLADTAGHELSGEGKLSELQRAAVEISGHAVTRAPIVLVVLDGSRAPDDEMKAAVRAALSGAQPAAAAVIWTKADLSAVASAGRFEILAEIAALLKRSDVAQFNVSAQSGAGIPALLEFLTTTVSGLGLRHADAVTAAAATGISAVRTAAAALERAHAGLIRQDGEDVVAVELREALHAFWQTEGVLVRHDAITESMLDRIFATFCIGK
jgi:tRNA modification GTPase